MGIQPRPTAETVGPTRPSCRTSIELILSHRSIGPAPEREANSASAHASAVRRRPGSLPGGDPTSGSRRMTDINHSISPKGDSHMSVEQHEPGTDRRRFLGKTAAASAGILASASAVDLLIPSFAAAKGGGVTKGDVAIVGAAQIAEALAVTTYTNIINQSPFFKRLPSDDQQYLVAARQEEMSHYALEMSVTGKPSPLTA